MNVWRLVSLPSTEVVASVVSPSTGLCHVTGLPVILVACKSSGPREARSAVVHWADALKGSARSVAFSARCKSGVELRILPSFFNEKKKKEKAKVTPSLRKQALS